MTLTRDDQIEAEVRRRFKRLLQSRGIDEGRIDLEVLFLLPVNFVRMYKELYEAAVSHSLSSPGGNASRDEGQVKASGTPRGGSAGNMNTRSMPAASAGKRFKEKRSVLRSESALEEKRKLDRRIIRAAEDAVRAAGNRNAQATGQESDKRGSADKGGGGSNADKKVRETCEGCGRKFGNGWKRCPYHD